MECPFCGADDMDYQGNHVDDDEVFEEFRCNNCNESISIHAELYEDF